VGERMTNPEGAKFVSIIRTRGKRASLRDTLESITFQKHSCHAIVVVHGDSESYAQVGRICKSVEYLSFTLLHAEDCSRKRGYPINLALDHLCECESPPEFIFLLDDDDIIYPAFSQVMADIFAATGADLVYTASNRLTGGEAPVVGYRPQLSFAMLRENFITSNSFAVRFASLRRIDARFDENFDYTEDWKFLVTLLEDGLRFEPDDAVLSEFRVPAASGRTKQEEEEWRRYSLLIREQINNSQFRISGPELVALTMRRQSAKNRLRRSTEAQIRHLEQRVWDLENSLSWRCTLPLRLVASWLMKISGAKGVRRSQGRTSGRQ
jgi:glycosyltransferase involved in cell wall biosynthesis